LSYKRLPYDLKRLVRLLSVVPGGDVGLETAAWLIAVSDTAVRPRLMALVRSHLIQQHVRNRWSMHDLIRLYSAELSALEPEDAEHALKSILHRYLIGLAGAAEWLTAVASEKAQKLFTSPQHAAGWFEAERTTAIAIVMSLAKRPDYREWILACTVILGEILSSQRHWLQEFHDVATVGASLVPDAQDRHYAACVLNQYGSPLRKMRQFADALEAFQRTVQVAEEIDDFGVADAARSNIGNVYLDQGRHIDEVLDIYWEDVRACRESDPPQRHHEAITLVNIGGALAKAERFAEALSPLRDAMAIGRDLDDRPGIASAAKNLGGVLSRRGREENNRRKLEEAIGLLQEAAVIYRERGNVSGWRTSPTILARRSASFAASGTAYQTLRPRSITSRDRVRPSWPLKFVKTCCPTNRTLRRKALGPQHVWAKIGIGSPILRAEGSRSARHRHRTAVVVVLLLGLCAERN
jgi:tetratricopeptide (TPR) repeat protein